MASDDDFYLVLVDDSVGDSGTQVIELKDVSQDKNLIVNDIVKHFKCEIKKENEVTSDQQDSSDKLFMLQDDDYNNAHIACTPTKEEPQSDEEQNTNELENIESKTGDLTNIGEYLFSISGVNLDDNAKKTVNKFVQEMVACAKSSPPPLTVTPHNLVNNKYECIYCQHISKTEKASIKHYRYKHGPKHYQCFACHSRYRRHDTLLFHEHYCNKEDSHLLRIARNIFNEQRPKREKTLKSNKYEKVPCRICSKLISKANMSVHIEAHLQIRKYKCKLCSASFRANRALKSHINYHKGEKPYQCDRCPKAYSSYNGFLVHRNSHKSVFYKCEFCKAKYYENSSLLKHRKIHLEKDSEPLLCTECGEVLPNKISMQIHLQSHNSEAKALNKNVKYKCSDCPKICNSLTSMKYHMRTRHNAEIFTQRKFLNMLPNLNIVAQVKYEEIVDNKCEEVEIDYEESNEKGIVVEIEEMETAAESGGLEIVEEDTEEEIVYQNIKQEIVDQNIKQEIVDQNIEEQIVHQHTEEEIVEGESTEEEIVECESEEEVVEGESEEEIVEGESEEEIVEDE